MADANSTNEAPLSSYEQDRRNNLDALRKLGVDPYGQRVDNVTGLAKARALFKPDAPDAGPVVTIAGRVMLKRAMGKLTFATLRDETGDLQIGLDKKRLSEKDWQVHDLVDLGDQIVVTGKVGTTKKGEVTVWVGTDPIADGAVTMAAKALLPPPTKELKNEAGEVTKGGFTDVEARYRQRYVDLWSNPDVMRVLKLRIQIVDAIREYLREKGFTEVETPMLQPIHGGAAARPFETHHNALDMKLFMRIAPELYLKRLLVGGFGKVFEINRNFRNEGISPRHNPEFTMLEAYEAFGSWETMAELVEDMICTVAKEVFGTLIIEHGGGGATEHAEGKERRKRKTINLEGDLTKPAGRRWRRVSMAELVEERTGWTFDKTRLEVAAPELYEALIQEIFENTYVKFEKWLEKFPSERRLQIGAYYGDGLALLSGRKLQRLEQLSPAEQLVEVYEKLIEHTLNDPTFVTRVPSVIIPLARKCKDDDFFADVYELAINGQEISPGYSELNDPDVQAENFRHQVGDKDEQQKVDEDFLTALKYGMPPAGGMGLGIDRLVMMLTGAESIRDVILFPLMRPQG